MHGRIQCKKGKISELYNHILDKRRVGEHYNQTNQAEKFATCFRSLLHLNFTIHCIYPQEGKKSRGHKKKHIEGARIFLLEYKMWLKSSGVQLADHPWAQYQQQHQAGMDDQQVK